jgi:hypothetical protein
MADHDYWASGGIFKQKLGGDDEWLREEIRRASDTDNPFKHEFFRVLAGSIKDQSDQVRKPFEWTCRGRHPSVLMFNDQKRCRYCKPSEEHEDDHPLFWRGGQPIYNDDLSWK